MVRVRGAEAKRLSGPSPKRILAARVGVLFRAVRIEGPFATGLLAALLSALVAAPAQAAEVRVDGDTLRFTAAPGELNSAGVDVYPTWTSVHEFWAPLELGPG